MFLFMMWMYALSVYISAVTLKNYKGRAYKAMDGSAELTELGWAVHRVVSRRDRNIKFAECKEIGFRSTFMFIPIVNIGLAAYEYFTCKDK